MVAWLAGRSVATSSCRGPAITQAASNADFAFVKASNETVAKWLEKEALRLKQHASKVLFSCTNRLEKEIKSATAMISEIPLPDDNEAGYRQSARRP